MPVIFTEEQNQAVVSRDCNLLLSAAAGSGKTAVLVGRIIGMICDEEHPVDIDRMLVVTFTRAAAAEMRERISKAIAEKLSENPTSEHLQRQASLLHNAQITTIDSFSLFLIRNHFNEIGLDPAFRVADEGEVKLLKQDVLKELLEDRYASGDEDFAACVEFFCTGASEDVLEENILKLSKTAAGFPWPEEWLLERQNDYVIEEGRLLAGESEKYLAKHLKRMTKGLAEDLHEALRIAELPAGPYAYGALLESEVEKLEKISSYESLEEIGLALSALAFDRLPSVRAGSGVDADLKDCAKAIRDNVKKAAEKLKEKFFFLQPTMSNRRDALCAGPIRTLIDLVLDFDRRILEKKQEKKILDFSDMEHYALQILLERDGDKWVPSRVAKEYRQHFDQIFIDEYQDSSRLQEYLLTAICGQDDGRYNLFMVGDVKQSIYRFRQARPELFIEKYTTYGPEGPMKRIDLSKNFRSRDEVLSSVNGIFSRVMTESAGGVEYDEAAALYKGATFPENEDCETEMLFTDPLEAEDSIRQEALSIAMKIKELKESFMVTEKEGLRPARYSDMVILVRTNKNWDEPLKEVLEQEGIPAHITSKAGYFAATEVREVLQFLRVLDNPGRDIALFGTLRSVFGGFTEEEIAKIRAKSIKGSLYSALKTYVSAEEEEDAESIALRGKVSAFLDRIAGYRKLTVYTPIRRLIEQMMEDCNYMQYVTALPGGSRRRANVEMLLAKASDFEKTSYFGLFHFVRYMEQLEKYNVDYGEMDVMDENADVVRIMSIHKSKGLEFPIVIVAGLNKKFNHQDEYKALVVDGDLGLGTKYTDTALRMQGETLRHKCVACKLKEDMLSEELRVLYVALTRPKEKLILSATLPDAEAVWEKQRKSGMRTLSFAGFMGAQSLLGFILPILDKTDIKVSFCTPDTYERRRFTEQVTLAGKLKALKESAKAADPALLAELSEKFSFRYPYEALSDLYTKTTVSELKIQAMAEKDEGAYHTFEQKDPAPYVPGFKRGEEAVSGALRGNAYHRIMEILDFDGLLLPVLGGFPEEFSAYEQLMRDKAKELDSALTAYLDACAVSRRLSEEYRGILKNRKIIEFLKSKIAYRMWRALRAGKLHREQPFVLGISASRLKKDYPADETVLIQGIIDVYFEEEDGLVLLDYKTDAIASMEALWDRYETQLLYYSEALERLLLRPVKEKVLYSFSLGVYNSRNDAKNQTGED